jgi:hypothetical protein
MFDHKLFFNERFIIVVRPTTADYVTVHVHFVDKFNISLSNLAVLISGHKEIECRVLSTGKEFIDSPTMHQLP